MSYLGWFGLAAGFLLLCGALIRLLSHAQGQDRRYGSGNDRMPPDVASV